MAPPPEYDKEPKAPDKSAANISTEDSKLLNNLVTDQHANSDHRSANTVTVCEAEKKHVETLDDGQLKALLDEAINYKNPKDREGKSKIFKELLEKAEQESEEQGGGRAGSGCRVARRGAGRRGPPLPHSNSLQDLVAALAAEPPRKHHARHHPPNNVSARAHHGGSLPSGVDTSSLSEEPARGAGYLATVRCVNPPPLAERRVSASDANAPAEMELLNRRSKPMFPMTYTARATLEIGSGAVCSGRAVTTTTSSNQVRTPPYTQQVYADPQTRLMSALCPTHEHGDTQPNVEMREDSIRSPVEDDNNLHVDLKGKTNIPRGPKEPDTEIKTIENLYATEKHCTKQKSYLEKCPQSWIENVDNWYRNLSNYTEPLKLDYTDRDTHPKENDIILSTKNDDLNSSDINYTKSKSIIISNEKVTSHEDKEFTKNEQLFLSQSPKHNKIKVEREFHHTHGVNNDGLHYTYLERSVSTRQKKSHGLMVPSLSDINPKNVKPMTVEQPQLSFNNNVAEESDKSKEIAAVDGVPVDINSNTVDDEPKDIEFDSTVKNKCISSCCCATRKQNQLKEVIGMFNKISSYTSSYIELKNIKGIQTQNYNRETFAKYVALQQELLEEIETIQDELSEHKHADGTTCVTIENKILKNNSNSSDDCEEPSDVSHKENNKEITRKSLSTIPEEGPESIIQYNSGENHNLVTSDGINSAKLSNNAYVLITSPNSNNNIDSVVSEATKTNVGKKKENLSLVPSHTNKKEDILNKNILKILLFENIKNNINEQLATPVVSSINNDEVDSAISFSCITTPEVVTSCNTTSSTSQSTLSADPKGRSVTSSSSYNGLPLSRPNYGSTATTTTTTTTTSDDYKKSLDENGNSVQGFSSPLSGSSQHKKPRRKKSSKNETVIDCQQIDGYQGDKNVDELLRFIESNADHGRAAKLPRVKHKDDSDDKGGKKRSAERRKDKESKIKRATSLEELSRTKIEDLTDVPVTPLRPDKKERRDHGHSKQERRSWGDDAYDAPATELPEFQTVTKKRKPRRRTDDRDHTRRTRAPSPRTRRESAPPSDRSNDSNDDMDSVHSSPDVPRATQLCAATTVPTPAAHASYAEIARTRNNIPDLIESCNFYAEGEVTKLVSEDPAGAPVDSDGYPALDTRTATTRRRDAKVAPAGVRRDRKDEAAADCEAGTAEECPAPDVVGERRPAVILADGASGTRDMDGVTFGFDVNEQLLQGGARCDLLLAHVSVRAGDKLLRYVPPAHQQQHMHIVHYVSTAWEDVVRCVGGKARYYSE